MTVEPLHPAARPVLADAAPVGQEWTVRQQASEAAFIAGRMEISTAKAVAAADSCARASHIALAKAYSERLADLTRAGLKADVRSLAR